MKNPKDEVQDSINKFVRGDISSSQFEDNLKKNNINPRVMEIDKAIRVGNTGTVSYCQVANAVNRFRDS